MAAPEFPAAVRPIPPDARRRAPVALDLDERQRKLIALLYAGHTDSSAAHRLGISPRTVTNILRALMDRLGVDNRFQLGMVLGSRLRVPERGGAPARPAPARPANGQLPAPRRPQGGPGRTAPASGRT
ncbi:helix-turn-helix transcriptional regulator [Streptomyces roseirectus]|uniref:Helix-turn-helix transcriptional regulator n=1 Tax=Streptomyces roseirectus TaxID=2768066 RepID=A0A7H0IJJ8_9ACTN|nr:helix-turn-helix transcriptional regulator [Streptomyces roseirectus]QNP72964.1 helix-turn-helix transcriptional regulator [Streptomyces roseirectus]